MGGRPAKLTNKTLLAEHSGPRLCFQHSAGRGKGISLWAECWPGVYSVFQDSQNIEKSRLKTKQKQKPNNNNNPPKPQQQQKQQAYFLSAKEIMKSKNEQTA